jgi:NADH-quinone oxidoreductase subunit L
MLVPLGILALLSVFVGWIETPPILGGIHQLDAWVRGSWYGLLGGTPVHHLSLGAELLLVLVVSAGSLGVAWVSYKNHQTWFEKKLNWFGSLAKNKFYVDEFYDRALLKPLSHFATQSLKWVDLGLVNGTGHFIRDSFRWSGQVLALFHTGSLQTYVFFALATLVVALMLLLGGVL